MKRNEADIKLLIAELEDDLAALEELIAANTKARERLSAGADDDLDYATLGYTIHNIYNLVENSFYRIAKHYENNISGDTWHRDLLHRMTLSLEDLRPAVIDADTADRLDELRSFRHVFRNMYRKKLDATKLMTLQEGLRETLARFRECIEAFTALLRRAV